MKNISITLTLYNSDKCTLYISSISEQKIRIILFSILNYIQFNYILRIRLRRK